MTTSQVKFYLIQSSPGANLDRDLQTIADQLGTYSDSGVNLTKDDHSLTISYRDTDISSTLTIEHTSGSRDVAPRQMVLTCDKADHVSVNLIKGIVKSMGYRVYNPTLESYCASDPNFLDLTTVELEAKIFRLFEVKKLIPLFQLVNSLVFYAKDPNDGSIHLTNRHLIQWSIEQKVDITKADHFSVKITPDITTFIALSDRGMIPANFYQALHEATDHALHINRSGFDIDRVNTDIYISPVFFSLDRAQQTFVSLGKKKAISVLNKLQKHQSIKQYIHDIVQKYKIRPLLAVKYPQNIEFQREKDGTIVPRMDISIFVDQ